MEQVSKYASRPRVSAAKFTVYSQFKIFNNIA